MRGYLQASASTSAGAGASAGATTRRHHAASIDQIMSSTEAESSRKRRAESQEVEEGGSEKSQSGEEAAAATVQPGEELGATEEEGGGIEDAILSRLDEDNELFTYDVVEDARCNVEQIVFLRNDTEVVFNRPKKDSDEWMLWRQVEKGRLALKRVKQLCDELSQNLRQYPLNLSQKGRPEWTNRPLPKTKKRHLLRRTLILNKSS